MLVTDKYGRQVRRRMTAAERLAARQVRDAARRQGYKRSFVPRTMGPFAQTERKYYDSFKALTALNETLGAGWTTAGQDPATKDCLFAPTEGSDINNRVGRKVAVHKISIRGIFRTTLSSDSVDIVTQPAVRMILFIDQQSNGVQVTPNELMTTPATDTLENIFSAHQSINSFGRFRVLKDKCYRMPVSTAANDNANGANSTISQSAPDVHWKIKHVFRKPLIVKFNNTNGGTIGDIVDNSFHICALPSGSSGAHSIAYECRTYFTDP